MWIFTLKDGTVVTGDREEIAKELNFFDDVWDDDVWDEFCDGLNVQWVDNDNVDKYYFDYSRDVFKIPKF